MRWVKDGAKVQHQRASYSSFEFELEMEEDGEVVVLKEKSLWEVGHPPASGAEKGPVRR